MKIKGVLIMIIIVAMVVVMNGCFEEKEIHNIEANLFDMLTGVKISESYLTNIMNGNMEEANKLCEPELISNNKDVSIGVSNIVSFSLNSTIEGNKYAYFVFDVVRSSEIETKSDLEIMNIKVNKKNDDYVITSITSKSEKELYVKDNTLRISDNDGGRSELVIALNNIPKDTYVRENEIMLYKANVPNESFSKVGFSFTGSRIAIATSNKEDFYVCIACIDETLMTTAEVNEGDIQGVAAGISEESQQTLENSIAKKIIPVDLFKNSIINKFTFSKEEDTLEIAFTNKYNVNRVGLYKTEDGSIIKTNFNKEFPEDKYNITSGRFEGEKYMFKVTAAEGKVATDKALIGEYIFNLKTLEIKKL